MAKFCTNCGSQCEDNYVNCPYCGSSFGGAQQVNNNNTQQYNQQNGQYNQQQYNQYNQQYNQYGQPYNPNMNYQADLKSKMLAGLFGVFLGSFGVHNFYLGFTGKAVAQLLLTLLTCGIGATISSIWGLIEGIMILCGNINTDAQGRPLKD